MRCIVRFDDTWLLDYELTTLCPVEDCQVRIAGDLIHHFVWFDNPQAYIRHQDLNTTRDTVSFLHTIPVDQIIFPLDWIWFENAERLDIEEEELSGLVYDSIVPNVREDDQDLLYLDQTEKNSSLLNFFSDSPGTG